MVPKKAEYSGDTLTDIQNTLNELSRDVYSLRWEIKKVQNHFDMDTKEISTERFKSVKDFFESRRLTILQKHDYDDIDKALRNLSNFIGKNHQHLHSTLEYFRANWSNGKKNISIPYKSYTNVEKTCLLELCSSLKNIKVLHLFRNDKETDQVHIYTNNDETDVSFIYGRWMEYYVGYRLNQLLKNSWSDHDYKIEYNLVYVNGKGESHEVDVFLLLDGIPYLFESKSGKTTGDIIGQIKDHLKIMQLKADRHVVVLTKFAEKDIRKIRDNNKHQVISLNTFDEDVTLWFKVKAVH